MSSKCSRCPCTHHWAFRQNRRGEWLCDPCWGYSYEEGETCWICDRTCYPLDDYQDCPLKHKDVYLCGHCVRQPTPQPMEVSS